MTVTKKLFGTLPDGREVPVYTLRNKEGMTLEVIPFGCRIVRLFTKDKNGELGNIVLGHRTLEEYSGNDYHGAFVGRYANRIGGAKFALDGISYALAKNDGENTLHGGPGGYHQVLWNVAEIGEGDEPFISFAHTSPDGDEGYPGALKMTVRYQLTSQNGLVLAYTGETDKNTVFNPTNHAFFNLSGNAQTDILGTYLQIQASMTTAVRDDLIPTGKLVEVAGTPLDFTSAKQLGADMFHPAHTISMCGGFDHNFCLDGEGLRKIAQAWEPESGRVMEVFTCMPGVQLYTMNTASGVNSDGTQMKPHMAFCLETQYYPDSPNHENFPFDIVKPGAPFGCTTEYRFSVK